MLGIVRDDLRSRERATIDFITQAGRITVPESSHRGVIYFNSPEPLRAIRGHGSRTENRVRALQESLRPWNQVPPSTLPADYAARRFYLVLYYDSNGAYPALTLGLIEPGGLAFGALIAGIRQALADPDSGLDATELTTELERYEALQSQHTDDPTVWVSLPWGSSAPLHGFDALSPLPAEWTEEHRLDLLELT